MADPFQTSLASTSTTLPGDGLKRTRQEFEDHPTEGATPNKAAKLTISRRRREQTPDYEAVIEEESPTPSPGDAGFTVDPAVDSFLKKHPIHGEVLAEDEELVCICLEPKVGDRAMIKCGNGNSCRLQWFHLECLGMDRNDLPDEDGKLITGTVTVPVLIHSRRMALPRMYQERQTACSC